MAEYVVIPFRQDKTGSYLLSPWTSRTPDGYALYRRTDVKPFAHIQDFHTFEAAQTEAARLTLRDRLTA